MIEEFWTGFGYGAVAAAVPTASGQSVPGRHIALRDEPSGRTVVLKMTEQEARHFAQTIVDAPVPPVIAQGDDQALRQGRGIIGVPPLR